LSIWVKFIINFTLLYATAYDGVDSQLTATSLISEDVLKYKG